MIEFNSEKELEFWCDICDVNSVNSENKNQGKFFKQYGHTFQDINTNNYIDKFSIVIFAICCDCLAKK